MNKRMTLRVFASDPEFLYVFIIFLSIFILGVQLGIKHGRNLEREDIKTYYGIEITN